MSAKKKSSSKKEEPEYKDVKQIGSIPFGYGEGDILFMKDNKIFIAKKWIAAASALYAVL